MATNGTLCHRLCMCGRSCFAPARHWHTQESSSQPSRREQRRIPCRTGDRTSCHHRRRACADKGVRNSENSKVGLFDRRLVARVCRKVHRGASECERQYLCTSGYRIDAAANDRLQHRAACRKPRKLLSFLFAVPAEVGERDTNIAESRNSALV